jgi:AP-3 complex subunit mu
MLPAVFILDNSGCLLLERQFSTTDRIPRRSINLFWEQAISFNQPYQVPTVLPNTIQGYYAFSIFRPLVHASKSSNLPTSPKDWLDKGIVPQIHTIQFGMAAAGVWLVTMVKYEAAAVGIVECLQMIFERLVLYLGDDLSTNSIIANFATVIQLLDEMFDAGFPYTTEPNQLTEMIKTTAFSEKMLASLQGKASVEGKLPKCVNSPIPWRKTDLYYVSNEIYLDIEESLDVIFSSSGDVVSSEISGKILCNSKLSGTPECVLRVTNFGLLVNASLHRCIRINSFRFQRQISFVPPDGQFALLEYYLPGGRNFFPITVTPKIALAPGSTRVKITVMYNVINSEDLVDVELTIPFPKSTLAVTLTSTVGTVDTDEKTKTTRWRLGNRSSKEKRFELEGSVSLPVNYSENERPTIAVSFKARNTTSSGLNVEELIIQNIPYKPYKGARTLTQAGKFFVRT